MDLNGLRAVLAGIERGEIRTRAIDTAEPSPFCHEILNANPYAFLDDAPLEERRARAVQLRRTLGTDLGEIGALDATAIATVADESWPVVRDGDELHDALLTLVAVPPVRGVGGLVRPARRRRAGRGSCGSATSRALGANRASRAHPVSLSRRHGGTAAPQDRSGATGWTRGGRDRAAARVAGVDRTGHGRVAGRHGSRCPAIWSTPGWRVSRVRGRCCGGGSPAACACGVESDTGVEWCNRRVLARIHRLTLGRLRREIEPVSSADFIRFLHRWQHLAPGTTLHGTDGLLQILRQLQGYEISGASLEREVLARRMSRYDPEHARPALSVWRGDVGTAVSPPGVRVAGHD